MQDVKGVKSAKVDFRTKSAVVVFDDAVTTIESIAAASAKTGYPARIAVK